MIQLVLIRHGETDWNREGRWQGQADVPLNANGVEQSKQLAKELASRIQLDAIYSSDLLRARQTAEFLAQETGLQVYLDVRLKEIDQGKWQGLQVQEIQERYSEIFYSRLQDPWNVAPPGGETAMQVRQRVAEALDSIARQHIGATVAIVAHGFVLAVARTIILGSSVESLWELVPENCDPIVARWDGV